MKRIATLTLSLAVTAASIAAQKPPVRIDVYPDDGHVHLPLWPAGQTPGAKGTTEADIPTLTVYLPKNNSTKSGIVIAPGGGYQHLALDHEGVQVANWLNQHGVAAFVLRYRLGPTYHHPIELGDAQRALRTVRTRAAEYGIQPDHLGIRGFSAGGHLASSTGTHFDSGKPDSADPIERASSRPDFMVLAYPVILMSRPNGHAGSAKYLLGENPEPALVHLLSNDEQVTPQTPPTFIFSTTDDVTVPVINSVLFYQALIKNHVQAELHLFRSGKHGSGLAQQNPDLKIWPDLLLRWLVANGWTAFN